MERVTEALKWVVEINSDYPAMIEIDKVDAKSHLAELATLRAEKAAMMEALERIADDKGDMIAPNWVVLIAKEALK